jgi:hypothetical protein
MEREVNKTMERFRIFISQFVTIIVIAKLAIRFLLDVIISTNLIAKFCYHVDKVSIVVLIGLIVIAISVLKFMIWLIKKPKIDHKEERKKVAKEKQIDMGVIKNIPTDR